MRLLCHKVIMDFFRNSACDILQNDLYRPLRHLKKKSLTQYLTTSQMETSGTWGTEIAVATLLEITIAMYYPPPGAAKGPLWHHYSSLCSDADTQLCTCIYLHINFNRI